MAVGILTETITIRLLMTINLTVSCSWLARTRAATRATARNAIRRDVCMGMISKVVQPGLSEVRSARWMAVLKRQIHDAFATMKAGADADRQCTETASMQGLLLVLWLSGDDGSVKVWA